MKFAKLWVFIAFVHACCAFLLVHERKFESCVKIARETQEIIKRPVSLAKRALLKKKLMNPEPHTLKTAVNPEPVIDDTPQEPIIEGESAIDVEALMDSRLRALNEPEVQLIMKEQGVTIKELLELSEAITRGEYNPYNRSSEARLAKTRAIKLAKKEAKTALLLSNTSTVTKPITRPRDPEGLSSPIPHRRADEVKEFNKPFMSHPVVGIPPPGDYQRFPRKEQSVKETTQERVSITSDATLLHGVNLKEMLTYLIEEIGFPGLYRETHLRCFYMEPSLISSLKCLRAENLGWARQKIEALYVTYRKKQFAGREQAV